MSDSAGGRFTLAHLAIGVAVIALIVAAAVGGFAYSESRSGSNTHYLGKLRPSNGLWCEEVDGLPGGAAGKMWATFDDTQVFDGVVYSAGTPVFLGYCDPAGTLIR